MDVLQLPGVWRGFLQQAHRTADAAQGRAQLVAQAAQEHILGFVGILCRLPRHGVFGHFAFQQGIGLLEFRRALGHLALECFLMLAKLLFQPLTRTHVVAHLLQGSAQRCQRVLVGGGQTDLKVASAQGAHSGLHAFQAAQHMVPKDRPQRHEKTDTEQGRHQQKTHQHPVDRALVLQTGAVNGLAARGGQGAGLFIELGNQRTALTAQALHFNSLRQALAAQGKRSQRWRPGQHLVMRQTVLLQTRVTQVINAPLQGGQAGYKIRFKLRNLVNSLCILQLVEQRFQVRTQELEFGHALHRVHVDLDQAVERGEQLLTRAVAIHQAVKVGNIGRGGGRGIGHQKLGQTQQGVQRHALSVQCRALALFNVDPRLGLRHLALEIVGHRRHRQSHLGALGLGKVVLVQAVQNQPHVLQLQVNASGDLPGFFQTLHPRQLLHPGGNARVTVDQALYRFHGRNGFIDNFPVAGHHLLKTEPGHRCQHHHQYRCHAKHRQHLADQSGAQVRIVQFGQRPPAEKTVVTT